MKSVYLIIIVFLSFSVTSITTLSSNASTTSQVISINGNASLNSLASTNGWSGSGTSADPYIIANYSISSSNQYSFVIRNTNLYVTLENNAISNGIVGIFVQNVQNLVIRNNSITNCEKFGILIDESANNFIVNNTISHTTNGMGLLITNSDNNLFNNNTSEYNSNHGFFISQNTTDNTFEYNYAIGNGNNENEGVGFYVVFATGNSLIGNVAINNTLYGIHIENSSGTYLKDNLQIGNGKILKGESYTRILLFIGIIVLLLIVTLVLAIINKKYS